MKILMILIFCITMYCCNNNDTSKATENSINGVWVHEYYDSVLSKTRSFIWTNRIIEEKNEDSITIFGIYHRFWFINKDSSILASNFHDGYYIKKDNYRFNNILNTNNKQDFEICFLPDSNRIKVKYKDSISWTMIRFKPDLDTNDFLVIGKFYRNIRTIAGLYSDSTGKIYEFF